MQEPPQLLAPGVFCYPSATNVLKVIHCHLEQLQRQPAPTTTTLQTTILLPTNRAVRELKLLHHRHNNDQAVVQPQVYSISGLIGRHPELVGRVLSQDESLMILKDIVDTHQLKTALTFTERVSLFRVIGECVTHGVTPEQMAKVSRDNLLQDDDGALRDLTVIYQQYLDRLAQKGLRDKNQALLHALYDFARLVPTSHHVIAAGIDGYLLGTKTLLQKIYQRPQSTILLPKATSGNRPPDTISMTHPDDLMRQMLGLLCDNQGAVEPDGQDQGGNLGAFFHHLFTDTPQARNPLPACVHVRAEPDLLEEVRAVRRIVLHYRRGARHRIAIICACRDRAYRIQQELSAHNISVDLASGTPLSHSAAGKILLRFLDLMGPSTSLQKTCTFLKSSGIAPDIRTRYAPLLHAWHRGQEATAEVLELREGIDAGINAVQQQAGVAFCQALQNFLHEMLVPEVRDAVASILQPIINLQQRYGPLSRREIHDWLCAYLEETVTRSPKTDALVHLIEPIQAPFIHKDISILCGLNEGIWPARFKPSAFLSRHKMLALGLPDPQQLIGRAAQLFCASFGTQQTYLTYAQSDGSTPLTPSRFVERLHTHFTVGSGETDLIAPCRSDTSSASAALYAATPKQQAHFLYRRPEPPMQLTLSVSDIVRYCQNPYNYYARKHLGLVPLQDPYRDRAHVDYGIWVHHVLERCVQEGVTDVAPLMALATQLLPKHLDRVQRAAFLTQLKTKGDFLRDLLADLLADRPALLGPKSHIKGLTGPYIAPELSLRNNILESDGVKVSLEGRIDCFKVTAENHAHILDYKTGAVPIRKEIVTLQAPQLPLLGWLAHKNAGFAELHLRYVDISSEGVVDLAYAKHHEATTQFLEAIARDMIQKERLFVAPANPSQAAPQDPYALLNRQRDADVCGVREQKHDDDSPATDSEAA